jgi:hypothetical protein
MPHFCVLNHCPENADIEPKIVFKNLFVQIAYNQKHQLTVAKQVSDFIESRRQDIRLLVFNNLTKFFRKAKRKDYAAGILNDHGNTVQRLHPKQNSIDIY